MTSKKENQDEDSFIILGSSPGTSLDLKYNGVTMGSVSLAPSEIEEAMRDLPEEASMALKAHFKIGSCPSPASLMAASTIITDDQSTEELQKRFGELLDENTILKETLKQNNDSMKEQFLLIASCQEDMMKTHLLHKEKFEETKELVERLRHENKKLKQDITRFGESESSMSTSGGKSGPPSAMEFVTTPDDDTINKLTSQLELVEKQRRQVIVENEKLTWQKESLEHIVDATSKERDSLKDKLKNTELQLLNRESEYLSEIEKLKFTIQELKEQHQASSLTSISPEEITSRDAAIQQLEGKLSSVQNDLKNAQLKILDLENVKLQYSQHKSGVTETVKVYKDQILELQNRLKETSTTMFQPLRVSLTQVESSSGAEGLASNVKLYDRTLRHLAELLNLLVHGLSDSLVETLGVVTSLYDYKLERSSVEQFKSGLNEVKLQLEKQHTNAISNIGQVRGTISLFEGIFKDYTVLVERNKAPETNQTPNVEALTSALVARGQELQMVKEELNKLRSEKEDVELLKAQLELYKSDFEAEREARQKMASEKETLLTDLRTTQRRNQELVQQLEDVRKLSPSVHRTATAPAKRSPAPPPTASTTTPTTSTMTYKCPKCMTFSSNQYKIMEEHFDFCLDDF